MFRGGQKGLGAHGHGTGLHAFHIAPGRDEPEPGEAEGGHRTRDGADVSGPEGLNQHNGEIIEFFQNEAT